MNPPKITDLDYINFLVGAQTAYSCLEAERVQPEQAHPPAHDAYNRLLQRLEPKPEQLWQEAQGFVALDQGVIVVDDSTLDKFHAQKMDLVSRQWSGNHARVVQGINLITLLWTDGDQHIPCDYRLYEKSVDGATKNDHFRQMIGIGFERKFRPKYVAFDSWYSSLGNLKYINQLGLKWLTKLKHNRLVNRDGQGNQPISQVELSEQGSQVHLKGYGWILVFKIVTPDGDIEYGATNDLEMSALTRIKIADYASRIENYHRGLKQHCGVERCQVRSSRGQRNHIGWAIRAFLRLEVNAYRTGISWFSAKTDIVRAAIRAYLAAPLYSL